MYCMESKDSSDMVDERLAQLHIANNLLFRAKFDLFLSTFSTVKSEENRVIKPRFIKRSELFEILKKVTKLKQLI